MMLYDLLNSIATRKNMFDYLMTDIYPVKGETVYFPLPGYNKKDIVYYIKNNKVILKTVEGYEEKPYCPRINSLTVAYLHNNYEIKELTLEDGLLTLKFEPKKEDIEFLSIK